MFHSWQRRRSSGPCRRGALVPGPSLLVVVLDAYRPKTRDPLVAFVHGTPAQVNGRSRRNLYYAGVGRLQCRDFEGAAEAFRRAVSDELSELASLTERDISVALLREARKGLGISTRGR